MPSAVVPVQYHSHDPTYRLDVEILDAKELRRRVESVPDRGYERADFLSILFVRSGHYAHTVDFETFTCNAGSCLVIRPGQVHRFGSRGEWDGWILIAGSQHVPHAVVDLDQHLQLDAPGVVAVAEHLARMAADARLSVDRSKLEELLVLETRVLVTRLTFGEAIGHGSSLIDRVVLARYREFRDAVEREHTRWHQVGPYARHLGYSAKSLDRACRASTAVTAKRVIVNRIILEAKRLLAHSDLPVASLSDDLGFDEPTNFVKYFKRETGRTPAQFRVWLRTDERA